MKFLFRTLLALVFLLAILIGIAYVTMTRPSVQKRIFEAQLPEGSSIEHIQVTPSKLILRGVDVQLPDGSRLQVGLIKSGFSPLAAIFGQTIRLNGVKVESLLIQLPKAVFGGSDLPDRSLPSDRSLDPITAKSDRPVVTAGSANAPEDVLYALGELQWLWDIDGINLQGVIIDGYENRYFFNVQSGAIAPGVETELYASLELKSKEALEGGLQNLSTNLRLQFKQDQRGGFESFKIDSKTSGSDSAGASLLSASQTLALQVDASGRSAELTFEADVNLPEPGVFLPEMSSLRDFVLKADLKAKANGSMLTFNQANLDLTADGQAIASVKLQQALTLGGGQQFAGRLVSVELLRLPLEWVNPWLPEGVKLTGAPFAAEIFLQSGSDGSLVVLTEQPLNLGPFSVLQEEQVLFNDLTLRMNPVLRVAPDQTLHYELTALQVTDGYGPFINAEVKGRKKNDNEDAQFGGLQSEAILNVGLLELLQQPALAGKAGVLSGNALLRLKMEQSAAFPMAIEVSIDHLRGHSQPGLGQDYRLTARLRRLGSGGYAIDADLQAGLKNSPSTSIQVSGQVNPSQIPVPFNLDVTATDILQRDLDILIAALAPSEALGVSKTGRPKQGQEPSVSATPPASLPSSADVERPAWADLDGSATVQIDEFILNSGQVIQSIMAQATVSESLLEVKNMKGRLQEGPIAGRARIDFAAADPMPYKVLSQINFENVDPAVFSGKQSGSFPVRGMFNGEFKLEGKGGTLEAALENSEAGFLITGRKGVLTAFDLDNRSQLGLLGVGLLGRQLDRPGITAMAKAVPYFKDIHFENFTLNLTRGQDKVVRIPELVFLGDNIRIEGQGFIGASRLDAIMDQPLQLLLELGAKGRLVDYLETLQLLSNQTSENGFRTWKEALEISGTIGNPDTSALKDMLSEAARRAISGRSASLQRTEVEGEPTDPVISKEPQQQRRLNEIDIGLDLLNSVFGN